MTALATVDDVEALGLPQGTVTAAMLEQASARFRSEARHYISVHTYRSTIRPSGGVLILAHHPVLTVDEVRQLDSNGQPGAPVVGWTFDGIDRVAVAGLSHVVLNAPSYDGARAVHVQYKAGYDPVPEDVRWAVAAMVKRSVEAGSAGVVSEQVGDFSRSFGGYTASGAFSMTRDEQATARRYRPNVTSVRLERY